MEKFGWAYRTVEVHPMILLVRALLKRPFGFMSFLDSSAFICVNLWLFYHFREERGHDFGWACIFAETVRNGLFLCRPAAFFLPNLEGDRLINVLGEAAPDGTMSWESRLDRQV
jgi:hypothetical protein